VVYATFVLALTMLPVILLSGLQGAFAPLGLAFLLATMASLLVALTVTPAFSLLLLGASEHAAEPACWAASRIAISGWWSGSAPIRRARAGRRR
jgi:multidrug efflux pump subunit AcrB